MDSAKVFLWNRFVCAIKRLLGRSSQIQLSFIQMLQLKPSELLMLHRLPARLDAVQTSTLLGFQPHDIPVLTRLGLLKPLGRPAPNSPRYFAAVYIEGLREDREWLDKATRAIRHRWQEKNEVVQTNRESSLPQE